jgi:chemotaxis family two-component system sensor kinase Cph1
MGNHLPQLHKMMEADGVAVLRGPELITSGNHPPPAAIRQLADWLLARPGDAVLASSALSELHPEATAYRESGSGILSIVLSAEQPWLVIWFRAEQVEVVNWAGNPHKAVNVGPGETLSPRSSFDAWEETVRERSRRWTPAEVESARRLRGALLAMRQNRRLKDLNGQLTRLLQEQTLLVEQKDYLIGEVNHRVQNSLQLVTSFLNLQTRAAASPEVRTTLEEARRRITAVALVHRRLYSGNETRSVDGARYIEELCTDTLAAMGAEWAANLALDLAPVLIPTDKAVTLGLVLTELFININKYAYGGAAGPIEVRLYEERANFTLEVADRGSGNASPRRGFGTRMIEGLVAQMGGVVTRLDNNPGLRLMLTAPI